MLRNYVSEHENNRDVYLAAIELCIQEPRAPVYQTTPFDLVFSCLSPPLSLHLSVTTWPPSDRERKCDFFCRMVGTLQTAYVNLLCTKERYERDYDKRVRNMNRNIHTGVHVHQGSTDGSSQPLLTRLQTTTVNKLRCLAIRPYRVLSNDVSTFVIDRDKTTKRVSADRVALCASYSSPYTVPGLSEGPCRKNPDRSYIQCQRSIRALRGPTRRTGVSRRVVRLTRPHVRVLFPHTGRTGCTVLHPYSGPIPPPPSVAPWLSMSHQNVAFFCSEGDQHPTPSTCGAPATTGRTSRQQ